MGDRDSGAAESWYRQGHHGQGHREGPGMGRERHSGAAGSCSSSPQRSGQGQAVQSWNLDAAAECESVHLLHKEKQIKAALAKFSRLSQLDFATLKAEANKFQSETPSMCFSG